MYGEKNSISQIALTHLSIQQQSIHQNGSDKLGWMQTKPIMVSFVFEIKFKSNYGIYHPRFVGIVYIWLENGSNNMVNVTHNEWRRHLFVLCGSVYGKSFINKNSFLFSTFFSLFLFNSEAFFAWQKKARNITTYGFTSGWAVIIFEILSRFIFNEHDVDICNVHPAMKGVREHCFRKSEVALN